MESSLKYYQIYFLDEYSFTKIWCIWAKSKDEAVEKFTKRKGNRNIVKVARCK